MAIADHQLGKLILCISATFFCYYTLWLWVPPFMSSSWSLISSRFFPSVRYALFVPALTGLIFNGGLLLFTLVALKSN